ncbi:hypothetical protein [Natrononativus amylolyticus]|uniref:hypothetical protein n=1 Tax=Natrononativus amylolyticus TaxID=2963434 RepID=UPI0020CEC4C7|nr:hypothetical protein [Natrononativus amylolyticus]
MRLRRNADPEPPGLNWEVRGPWKTHSELTNRGTLEYDGSTYFCRTHESNGGAWRVAYGSPIGGDGSRVFLFSDGDLRWTKRVASSIVGLVSRQGTVMILGGGDADDLNGSVHVFDSTGTRQLHESYQANVADGDLSGDGSLAVVQTQPPDNTTYLYELEEGRLVAAHSSDWAQPTVARFGADGESRYVYLSVSHAKRPIYTLDETGAVAWESDRHRKMRPLMERLRTRFGSS